MKLTHSMLTGNWYHLKSAKKLLKEPLKHTKTMLYFWTCWYRTIFYTIYLWPTGSSLLLWYNVQLFTLSKYIQVIKGLLCWGILQYDGHLLQQPPQNLKVQGYLYPFQKNFHQWPRPTKIMTKIKGFFFHLKEINTSKK